MAECPTSGWHCDGEELRSQVKETQVPASASISWGDGLDLTGLGFPICKVKVILRIGQGLGHGMWSGNAGYYYYYCHCHYCPVQLESLLDGHGGQLASLIWDMS